MHYSAIGETMAEQGQEARYEERLAASDKWWVAKST